MSYDVALLIPDAMGDEFSVWDGNYTSNMAPAWREAGIQIHEWDEDTLARDVVDSVRRGIAIMEDNPRLFMAFEPDNGWGSYLGVLDAFLKPMLDAMERWPDARVRVWR